MTFLPSAQPTSASGRLIEWQYSLMMIVWGMWLLAPGDTFAAPQYALLREIAPENVWGAFSVSIGSMRMTALAVNGHWRRTPILRVIGSIFGVLWWVTMAFLFLSGPEQHIGAGVAFYFVFIFFEGISCWRSSADAFHAGSFKAAASSRGIKGAA